LTKPLILANNHKASLKSWRSVQRRMGFRRASFLKIGTILPPRAPPPLSTYFYCHVHLLPPTFTCPACWTACTTAGRLRLCACGERRRAGAPPSRPPIPSNSGRDPRRQEIEPRIGSSPIPARAVFLRLSGAASGRPGGAFRRGRHQDGSLPGPEAGPVFIPSAGRIHRHPSQAPGQGERKRHRMVVVPSRGRPL
jgi:hypothetical protein